MVDHVRFLKQKSNVLDVQDQDNIKCWQCFRALQAPIGLNLKVVDTKKRMKRVVFSRDVVRSFRGNRVLIFVGMRAFFTLPACD